MRAVLERVQGELAEAGFERSLDEVAAEDAFELEARLRGAHELEAA